MTTQAAFDRRWEYRVACATRIRSLPQGPIDFKLVLGIAFHSPVGLEGCCGQAQIGGTPSPRNPRRRLDDRDLSDLDLVTKTAESAGGH